MAPFGYKFGNKTKGPPPALVKLDDFSAASPIFKILLTVLLLQQASLLTAYAV